MANTTNLTEAVARKLAEDWYRKLDVHAPEIELLPMLAEEGLEMRFPEATLRSLAEFESWYQGVIRIFFDEIHELKKCDVRLDGGRADLDIIVKWEASFWKPPARNSQRIRVDAYQTWSVTRSAKTGQPVVITYTVDEMKYYDGSARL